MATQTSATTSAVRPSGVLGALGPTVITAALMFGPGSITLASTAGALYGYQLLWVPVVATILMIVFCDLAVRIGLGAAMGADEVLRHRFGAPLAVLAALSAALVCSSFQAGNSIGTGIAAGIAVPGDIRIYAGIFTALGIGMVWLPRFYTALERLMTWIVGVMLVVFIITMVAATPDLGGILGGLVPSVPSAGVAIVVGITATTFSVVGALFQIQLVREKGWTAEDYPTARLGVVAGITILGLLSVIVMITAAAVLHPVGHVVQSPADLAEMMRPVAGTWAAVLFAVGLWGAAFSSLVGNATIGGGMLSAVFGWGQEVNATRVKSCITVVMAVGGVVAMIFGSVPLELITTAQAVTIFGVPLIGVLLVILGRSSVIRQFRVGTTQWVLSIIGVVFLLYLASTYVQKLLA
ncbi:Nramp family divalent metal transporter [Ornithinimicrobium cavernae]|uniref:Nramp family divalent metal transporter n=1 Tax=Ornithinimicrobium cavernae TaxID=2666047 RepID=UPI000D699B13|nr:Nramp family divalent metal transporter [Ornithinimicrobium cavernae]